MPAYSLPTIQAFFQAADVTTTMPEKGKALEDLAEYLFTGIPGITIAVRNRKNVFATEEIDIAFWNEQHNDGLKAFDPTILVECKNWSKPVGSMEVNWFLSKVEHRGERFGILLAANGITGDAQDMKEAHRVVANYLLKRIRLIVISREEILALTSSDELVKLIKVKYCEVIATGTVV
jgi:hypothetical protein